MDVIAIKKLIIIPAYNEEKSILKVIENIKTHAPDFDYIVIDDCSEDRTAEVCKKNNVNILSLPINLGIGGAMQTGYKYAEFKGYDCAVQIDGDGQHDAAFVGEMVEKLKDHDLVIGSRYIDRQGFQSSFLRRLGIKYFCFLIRLLTGRKFTDPTSGLRACNKKTIAYFAKHYPLDYPEPEVIVHLSRKNFSICETNVIMHERNGGVSSITPIKSVHYMLKVSLGILFAWLDYDPNM